MSVREPARHALYSRLEEVLGQENADTLMTHLPQDRSDQAVTRTEFNARSAQVDARFDRLDDRFDRLEDRFDRLEEKMDRMQRFYVGTMAGSMTGLTAIFSFVALLTR